MRKKGNHQKVITLLIGLVLTLTITISPVTANAGALNFNIDFESPSLYEARRQVINPYVDPYNGVTFTAEPNYSGDGIVGLVKNSETSACAEPKNADQKLGTAPVGSSLIGYGTFPIRATFPGPITPPITVSAEYQTSASATINIRLFDEQGNLVAAASDSDLTPNGTCGYPGNARARKKLSITSEDAVSYAILEVYPPAYVLVIDNFEYSFGNQPPIAEPSSPYSGLEGFPIRLDGSRSYDPDGDPLSYHWTAQSESCQISDPNSATPEIICDDNGVFTSILTVYDGQTTDWDTAQIIVDNAAPSVGGISVGPSVSAVGTQINADADFSDRGRRDTHTALWDWGDGTQSEPTKLNQEPGNGEAFGSHTYTSAGVYTIKLTVTDDDGDSGTSEYQNVVVYNPEGGFVTGGGWIWSRAGTYVPEPNAVGWANFGFVARYRKGAEVPDGQAELVYHTAGMNFHSTEYDWLVVTGGNTAKFKGRGTINGEGDYKFMIWAGDGEQDTFRIKIWEESDSEEVVIYDNDLANPDYENGQPIGKGSIVIHDEGEEEITYQCTDGWTATHTDTSATYILQVDRSALGGYATWVKTVNRVDQSLSVFVTSLYTGNTWSFTEPHCGVSCSYLIGWYGGTGEPVGEGAGLYRIEISQAKKGEVGLRCVD